MRVERNSVYVIPPNTELSLVGAALKLTAPAEPRGMRLPVNVLFSSLASVQGEQAVAVVLSGMGSDGTLGMLAIKAVGGLTAAQEPAGAQFDSMPRSAIAAAAWWRCLCNCRLLLLLLLLLLCCRCRTVVGPFRRWRIHHPHFAAPPLLLLLLRSSQQAES